MKQTKIKPKTLKPIRHNVRIEQKFSKKLRDFNKLVNKSCSYWLLSKVRKFDNNDISNISKALEIEFNRLLQYWNNKAIDFSEAVSKSLNKEIMKYANAQYKQQGFTITTIPYNVKQAINANILQNMALIKTIPRDVINKYQTTLYNSINSFDLQAIEKQIKNIYNISNRRVKIIARDQVGKALENYSSSRSKALGFEYYVWNTSRDERVSKGKGGHRQLDGRIYRYDTPTAIIDSYGNKGHTADRVNCLAKGQGIDFDYFPKRLFRADCELASHFVKLTIGDEILIVTSDHKVLTSKGWVKAQSLNKGDYIIQKQSQNIQINKVNFYQNSFILSDFFSLFDKITNSTLPNALRFKRVGVAGDFDKNIRFDKNIDIIDFHSLLRDGVEFFVCECLKNIDFANATMRIQFKAFIRKFFSTLGGKTPFGETSLNATHGIVGFFSNLHSILFSRIGEADKISLATRADMIANLFKVARDNISSDTKIARHFENAIATHIGLFQFIYIQSYIIVWARLYALNKHTLPNQSIKNIARDMKLGANIFKENTLREARIDSITHISGDIDKFSHIYSLETNFGYYSTNKGILSKNCRCVATPLILDVNQDVKKVSDNVNGDYYIIINKK